jgi:ABC-type polysaccharide/polyol phosphate transport system ATPase subunit
MSDDVVIRAEGLGKKYVIGHQAERERYATLRDVVGRNLRNWGRSAREMLRGAPIVAGDETEEFWALKDVNFEIKRGDVVGIIGRNGAGKSTLLKVLSRITEPTEGRVTIHGRVASLLEVGTGFHPELTGRENIYLNGAILGMMRTEIRRKFDEIVDFAGVERFLDTPVKRYSSGMYVRLAFAVAAHLEPEILIVDEVLAVGDAEFQKKCLGKMKDVAGQGRTVLFVSHNMAAIRALCDKAIYLESGTITDIGNIVDVIETYSYWNASINAVNIGKREDRKGTGQAILSDLLISTHDGSVSVGDIVTIKFDIKKLQTDIRVRPWFLFRSVNGYDSLMVMPIDVLFEVEEEIDKFECLFNCIISPGRYYVTAGLLDADKSVVDWVENALIFNVESSFSNGSKYDERIGITTVFGDWKRL